MTKDELAIILEKLSVHARLQDLALFIAEGEEIRRQRIMAVLDHLEPGVYLIGAGPYAQGVYSLMYDETVIGRLATVLERSVDKAVDVFVNDAAALTPREVSRVHCAIYRSEGVSKHDYWIIDRGSSCGTYLNRERLDKPASSNQDEIRRMSRALASGDVISLGPSSINTFVFVDLRNA
jgi:pSer/pThr/pTyr-binding forkhead associated (FHA) protein